ncbi:neutral zinc metallopeptidase [Jatrophihabitans fulvus]
MRYDDDAQLDTSEVTDARGGSRPSGLGGGGLGGGLLPLLIGLLFRGKKGAASWIVIVLAVGGYLVLSNLGGGGGGSSSVLGNLGSNGQPAQADNNDLAKECRTGADANDKLECAVVADINSIQDYWGAEYPKLADGRRYTPVDTVFFSGGVDTRCGSATSDAGPFYCPGDRLVYIDLSFYDQLKSQFGATGGPLVNAYVLAHEYGHHVQDLLGTEGKVRTRQGASSDSVKLELQADCYAGVWMNHATQPQGNQRALIVDITQADLDSAVDAAQRIGDDFIQKNLGGGTVRPDTFTHGSSAQRKQWLTRGYRSGDPTRCDTFAPGALG